MIRAVEQTLGGWGNVPREMCRLYRAHRPGDVREVLFSGSESSFVSRGLGRSYGDAALNRDAGVLLHHRLNRFIAFDADAGILECEAGVSIDEILDVFVPRGYFPPVVPGTRFVTVGGAIAADVHGKNHHRDGTFSAFVIDFDLLTGTGEVIHCSREQNADVFWATVGGMGLTGAILSARIRLTKIESAYIQVTYNKTTDLDHTLKLLAEEQGHYSVVWMDCLAGGSAMGRGVLMRGRHARADELPAKLKANPLNPRPRKMKNVPFHFPGFVLNRLSIKAFNWRYYGRHSDETKWVDYREFFFPLDSIGHWNRIYGRRGFMQYQAVLPIANSAAGMRQLMDSLVSAGQASFLAVLKTMGPANDGMLSFPMAGHTLALDIPNRGRKTVELLHRLDRIVLDHGGRLYLAKDAVMTRETFQAMYPRLAEFQAIVRRLDPEYRFNSSQSQRLHIRGDR